MEKNICTIELGIRREKSKCTACRAENNGKMGGLVMGKTSLFDRLELCNERSTKIVERGKI